MNIAVIISISLVLLLLLVALIYSRRELRLSRAETAIERENARKEADEQLLKVEELQSRIVDLTAEKGEVQTEADESYTSHNTTRLDVEGTVKKLLTTDYVRNALEAAK